MSKRKEVPNYRRHKQSGQSIVTLTDGQGRRRDMLLGKHCSAASRHAYARVIAEWEATGRQLPARDSAPPVTISGLLEVYWPWVKSYYRHADGTPTKEVSGFVYSLRPLKFLYGDTPAADFGPTELKAVRDLMIRGYKHPRYKPLQPALSRGVINHRIDRIRRMFRWAGEQNLVPPSVLHGLRAVQGLKRGRTEARETKPVLPVARALVEETLPLLRPMVADMVRLQLETGMRSGELVTMRAIDLETTGKVWLYRPAQHKTQHHGYSRVIAIGPKGQEIIRRYLGTELAAPIFSPRADRETRSQEMRAKRKTPVQPSQQNRRKKKPKRPPGQAYTVESFGRSIANAIERHNDSKSNAEQIPHWHPHQLRHLRALEVKREAGLDVARAVLGHRSPVVSEMYAGLDLASAAEVMGKMG